MTTSGSPRTCPVCSARITTSGIITQYPLPTLKSSPEGIADGPGNTSIWWTESSAGQVGNLPWLAQRQISHPRPDETQYNALRQRHDRSARRQPADLDPHRPRPAVQYLLLRREPGQRLLPDLEPVPDVQLRHGRRPADHCDQVRQLPQRPGADPAPGHAHLERHAPAARSSSRRPATARATSISSAPRSPIP